jgi:DNA (cytosine-5)-methyltransferase 1
MKVLSLFSGVGGFDLGLENAGMETVFQCEWDKHAIKILERHWPHVPRWDDVSTLTGEYILRHAPVIDVVAWGSPCQDLSVAGKRAGLQGARSGLFHEGVRIIKELRELTNGKYPRISIWENVAGALSSGAGADFGQVLTEMDEAGACFSEWRMLDAQYFGVPQRRRRVFLISVFDTATAARCPDPLLPVSEGVQWHPQTGNTARQTTTSKTAASVGGGRAILGSDIVGPLAASDWKFPQQQQVNENKIVLQPFTKGKRPQSATDDETWDENRPAPTINAFDQGDTRATTVIVQEPLVFQPGAMVRLGTKPTDGIVPTLRAEVKRGDNEPVIAYETEPVIPIQDGRDMEKHQNGLGIAQEGAPSYTLDQTGAQAIAYGLQGNMIGRQDHNGPQGAGISHPDDPMFSLTSTDRHGVATTMAVRRLTPLECERLMGWPDDWTAGQSDTHRYKQCGNGVASPVAQWIGEQLMELNK